MAKKLSIQTLGQVVIELDDQPLAGLPSRAAEALLIYLACHDRPVLRETLADLLWHERSRTQGLTNLRTILSGLRQELADHLIVTRESLAFDHTADYWLDAADVETQLTPVLAKVQSLPSLPAEVVARLRRGLTLYQGHFLDGFSLRAGRDFETWVLLRREQLQRLASTALGHLVTHHLASGDYRQGVDDAERLLAYDPYNEVALQQLMRLLTRVGQPLIALQRYQDFSHLLATELNVDPSPETTRLYQRIKAARTLSVDNLPVSSTPFVGREPELRQLEEHLVNPNCRLITLTGPGGIGKTRLAMEIAARQNNTFLHGICFVPLASLQSAELLVATLADALKLSLDPMSDPKAQVLNALQQRETLLVLDNYEHLLFPPGEGVNLGLNLLTDILTVPDVKLLITSRERLNLEEEWLFNLDGLAVPATPRLEEATAYSAVQLFLQSAVRVRTSFAAADQDMADIIRVCRQVEGMPLGIKLAAAWVRVISCRDIADEIEHSLTLLRSSTRNPLPRHRSVEAVFDHSWQLLSPEEQRVLCQLSVFRGGFELEAAQQVAGATESLLAGLVDKSWLTLNPEGRYDSHDLLRRYAALRLGPDNAGQTSEAIMTEAEINARTRHAEYFAAFLKAQQIPLGNEKQLEAMAEVTVEFENVRVAWLWLVSQGNVTLIGRVLESLWLFFEIKNQFQEAEEIFGQGVEAVARHRTGHPADLDPELERIYAQLLIRQGWFQVRLARFGPTREMLEQGLMIARRIEDELEIGRALHHLGQIEDVMGHYVEAEQLLRESLTVLKGCSRSTHFDLGSSGHLGALLMKLGQVEVAQPILDEAVYHYEQTGNLRGIAVMYTYLGGVLIQQGNYHEAKPRLLEALAFQEEIDDWVYMRMSLALLGEAHERLGEYEQAKQRYEESLLISRGNGDRLGMATALNNLGRLSVTLAQHRRAKAYLKDALTMASEIQFMPLIIDGLISVAALLVQGPDKQPALDILVPILDHPAIEPQMHARATQLLAGLTSGAPAEILAKAKPTSRLETVVAGLLAEGSLLY
jgi:predicted ATPase/DNA-binding SARP family transcriptional activator